MFEPGLVLKIFSCFPASRSWVQSSLFPCFFCNKRVAENIPVLGGRLVQMLLHEIEMILLLATLKTKFRPCRKQHDFFWAHNESLFPVVKNLKLKHFFLKIWWNILRRFTFQLRTRVALLRSCLPLYILQTNEKSSKF